MLGFAYFYGERRSQCKMRFSLFIIHLPWFLLFMCFPSCTEVFETSVKDEIPGWLEAGCCNLCLFQYHFSYLNHHFVFKLWIYYGVNSCSSPHTDCSVIYNANLHNAQHSFSPGHTAFSTKFIFMPFN